MSIAREYEFRLDAMIDVKIHADGRSEVVHVEVIRPDSQAESSEPASGSSSGSVDAVWESIADFTELRTALAEVRAGAATIASTCRAIGELTDQLAERHATTVVAGTGETRDGAQDATPVAASTGNAVLDLLG